MDDKSIILRDTYKVFKHEEDCPYAFICDKNIAPIIATLNKKGYTTYASCGGHYKKEFYEWFNEDKKNLEEYKKDSKVIITDIRENNFDYISIVDRTVIYILFNQKYEFSSLPEGFHYYESDGDERTCIESYISYYENNKRKKRNIVEKEIEKNINKLNEWAKNLPNGKE